MPDSIKKRSTVDLRITPAQHKDGWKKQNAKTTYNYLFLTHKYYKTLIFNLSLNKVYSILQLTSTEFGFVPLSWCKIIDVEIKTIRKNWYR